MLAEELHVTGRHARGDEAHVPAARRAAAMDDLHVARVNDLARAVHHCREVDVLHAEPVTLVPAADFVEDFSRKEHRGPHQNLDRPDALGIERVAAILGISPAK